MANLEGRVINVTLILLVSLTTIMWFNGNWGKLILGEDLYFPINPSVTYHENFFTWRDGIASGVYNEQIYVIPYLFLLKMLNSVLPIWLVQHILFALFVIITFVSFDFFIKTLLNFDKERFKCVFVSSKRSSATLAAFLYTFNPYTLIVWYFGWTSIILSLLSFPLAFACFLKGFKRILDKNVFSKKSLKWMLLSALIPSLTFAAYPTIFLWLLLVTSFSIYFLIVMRMKIRRIVCFRLAKYVVFYFMLFALLNIWWALPYTVAVLRGESIFARATTRYFEISTSPSTLLELFRLLGEGNYYQVGRVPAGEFYFNPIISLLIFTIVIFSLSALLHKRQSRSYALIVYFALLYLLSLFITKGVNPPFDNVNMFAFEYVPFFKMFRAPWGKFMLLVMFSLSTLFAFSLQSISINTHRPWSGVQKIRILIRPKIIFMILLIILSYPITSGSIYASHGIPTIKYWDPANPTQVTRPYHVTIPEYYYDAATFINAQPEPFSVMILPYSPFYAGFNWGYTGGWDFLDNLLNKPITNVGLGYVGFKGGLLDIYRVIVNHMKNKPSPEDAKTLYHFFNVKYVIVLRDWNFNYIESLFLYMPLEEIERVLPEAGFTLDKRFGEVAIYLNNYWNGSKTMYVADTVLYVNDSESIYDSLPVNFLHEQSLLNSLTISTKSVNLPYLIFQNALEGYFNNSSWLPAVIPPDIWSYIAEYPNATVSYDVYIPEAGTSKIYAYVRWDGQRGTLTYKIDNGTWSNGAMPFYGNEGELDPYIYGTLLLGESHFTEGHHTITFMNTKPYIGAGYPNIRHFFLLSSKAENNEEPVDMSFEKVNPTRYIVHINAAKPFALVFSESYHKEWIAYIDGRQIPDEYHFIANGYANAWYINKTGTYTITLEFWPQKLFYTGSAISITTLILCILYISKNKLNTIYHRYIKKRSSESR